ncbi:MAG: undecaprenyldiphospho-muramoylpentapeptide beta-N-acetylglucosaminyltransferase [Alphaproteobacteria bacterium]|nr:MAG: undecaprenyldiphospho-muramoylpentapeptide beta-N-acetylglucosaminyltransferase [Alphaproteobacteria bacterium]
MRQRTIRHVVIAAGGTGGHMFPAQALARELIGRGIAVTLVTDRRGAGFGPDLSTVATHRISAGALSGGGLVRKMRGGLDLVLGYVQARRLLRCLNGDVVVGFGGYPSVPTVLAGRHLGLRVVLHEQNAVLGRANRLLAPRADAIAVSFAGVAGIRPADRSKVRLTGNPVRPEIVAIGQRPYAVPGPDDPLCLLVIGGSQGARIFNRVVPKAVTRLPTALRTRLAVCQQVRGDEIETVAEIYRVCGVRHDLRAFFADMPARLAAANLVIGRAGASTVAELAAAGRPGLLVPYPHATDDHQSANARSLAEAGGAWVLPQATLTPELLAERLGSFLANPSLLARAAHCARACAHPDAAARLADVVLARDNGDGAIDIKNGNSEAAA